MYEKYQEAADALRHEKWGRKHAEAILEQVLILTSYLKNIVDLNYYFYLPV